MTTPFDAVVVGGGVMGCTTALFLARGGMRVTLIDRGLICRGASGVNAGTLTLHMTRAALIPYAMRGWQMWQAASEWLGHGVAARGTDGLCLAFTSAEAEMLEMRVQLRRAAGAPITLISTARAREIEPGLSPAVRLAAYCPIDGHAEAYRTGHAFRTALEAAGVRIVEGSAVRDVAAGGTGFDIHHGAQDILAARRLILAGGVWLEEMLGWLGVHIPVKVLVNQLIITERMAPVMRSVLTIASGLLSLKQFENGTVLLGGGWQGRGSRDSGTTDIIPANVIGNAQLARAVIPALGDARILRIWLGLEAETADALPMVGPVPGVSGAFVIGSVHSGYTSGPWIAQLLAEIILGRPPTMPLFDPARLLDSAAATRSHPV